VETFNKTHEILLVQQFEILLITAFIMT